MRGESRGGNGYGHSGISLKSAFFIDIKRGRCGPAALAKSASARQVGNGKVFAPPPISYGISCYGICFLQKVNPLSYLVEADITAQMHVLRSAAQGQSGQKRTTSGSNLCCRPVEYLRVNRFGYRVVRAHSSLPDLKIHCSYLIHIKS